MQNEILELIKEKYPNVIKNDKIDLKELEKILGLPLDINEKINGYGLNFVGKNYAYAKYAQKTEKELKVNLEMSKNFDITQNLVLKGDNLDALKILKNHYNGKIKFIYIDPPYNTNSENFIYPDSFSKEEAETLGLVNLSDDDFARMELSFKSKNNHNGWLTFIYPRLLLAKDLLSNDGVIFISIDDNEIANLRLLCDEIFGEENFVSCFVRKTVYGGVNFAKYVANAKDYVLFYAKDIQNLSIFFEEKMDKKELKKFKKSDEKGFYILKESFEKSHISYNINTDPQMAYSIYYNPKTGEAIPKDEKLKDEKGFYFIDENYIDKDLEAKGFVRIIPSFNKYLGMQAIWIWGMKRFQREYKTELVFKKKGNSYRILKKYRIDFEMKRQKKISNLLEKFITNLGTKEISEIFGLTVFDYPKPSELIKFFLQSVTKSNDIVLDFFAGSGTTGHAVMQLNAEDGGKRKFILVQIDEPIKKNKPAYQFCMENNLPPVISSITIERLKRAGEKIKKQLEEKNEQKGLFKENEKQNLDIGFKVFDIIDLKKIEINDKRISILENDLDSLSKIYNMIFKIGIDEPNQMPEEIIKDSVYKIENHYYIINSEKISKEQFFEFIKKGKVFVDGWSASLNKNLQYFSQNVKIVF